MNELLSIPSFYIAVIGGTIFLSRMFVIGWKIHYLNYDIEKDKDTKEAVILFVSLIAMMLASAHAFIGISNLAEYDFKEAKQIIQFYEDVALSDKTSKSHKTKAEYALRDIETMIKSNGYLSNYEFEKIQASKQEFEKEIMF